MLSGTMLLLCASLPYTLKGSHCVITFSEGTVFENHCTVDVKRYIGWYALPVSSVYVRPPLP
ncbi:MAG: hypothetical protein IJC24_04370 [Clostridia bacterium]|nr:hypothetical protein [Clostridia bacterium]